MRKLNFEEMESKEGGRCIDGMAGMWMSGAAEYATVAFGIWGFVGAMAVGCFLVSNCINIA